MASSPSLNFKKKHRPIKPISHLLTMDVIQQTINLSDHKSALVSWRKLLTSRNKSGSTGLPPSSIGLTTREKKKMPRFFYGETLFGVLMRPECSLWRTNLIISRIFRLVACIPVVRLSGVLKRCHVISLFFPGFLTVLVGREQCRFEYSRLIMKIC